MSEFEDEREWWKRCGRCLKLTCHLLTCRECDDARKRPTVGVDVEPTDSELIELAGVDYVRAYDPEDLRKAYRLGVAHGKLQRK
jgi:hypothetical protein